MLLKAYVSFVCHHIIGNNYCYFYLILNDSPSVLFSPAKTNKEHPTYELLNKKGHLHYMMELKYFIHCFYSQCILNSMLFLNTENGKEPPMFLTDDSSWLLAVHSAKQPCPSGRTCSTVYNLHPSASRESYLDHSYFLILAYQKSWHQYLDRKPGLHRKIRQ